MSKFMISAKLQQLKEQFYKKSSLFAQLKTKNVIIVLLVVIFVCFGCYLFQVNSLVTKSYSIKELEEKVSVLKEGNKRLEVEMTELRSSARINQAITKLEMVKVARVEYLQANGSTVAINR